MNDEVHLVGDAREQRLASPGMLFCSWSRSGRPSSHAASATGPLT